MDDMDNIDNMDDIEEIQIIHVQSVLPKTTIDLLKRKTKKSNIKDAIATAIYYYLKNHE